MPEIPGTPIPATPQPIPSDPEGNKAKVLQMLDAFNTGDTTAVSQLLSRNIYAPGAHFVHSDMNSMPAIKNPDPSP